MSKILKELKLKIKIKRIKLKQFNEYFGIDSEIKFRKTDLKYFLFKEIIFNIKNNKYNDDILYLDLDSDIKRLLNMYSNLKLLKNKNILFPIIDKCPFYESWYRGEYFIFLKSSFNLIKKKLFNFEKFENDIKKLLFKNKNPLFIDEFFYTEYFRNSDKNIKKIYFFEGE